MQRDVCLHKMLRFSVQCSYHMCVYWRIALLFVTCGDARVYVELAFHCSETIRMAIWTTHEVRVVNK